MSEPGSIALWVGSYRAKRGAGLYPLRYEIADDRMTLGEADPAIANASFGAISPGGRVYLVDEAAATIAGFAPDGGRLRKRAQVASGGAQPCYLALDRSGRWLACANYGGGSLALFSVADGALAGPAYLHANRGGSVDPDRQEAPHVHCALFHPSGRWLHAVDLGTDLILSFPFDAAHGITGTPFIAWAALPGCGPRHLVFHPRLAVAYLVSELSSTLAVLDCRDDGTFVARDVVSTLPGRPHGTNLGGHLTLDANGTRLYVTNRGHDSVATFAIDEQGNLRWLSHIASGGASPRFLLLLEGQGRALVANEEGGSVTAFRIAPDGLSPISGGTVPAPGAAFICPGC